MLLLLTPGFAAHEDDHSCIPPVQLFARELLARGVSLHIVALEYPYTAQPYSWNGALVYPCNGQNRRWLKPRTAWRANTFCHQILQKTDCAAIHSFWLGLSAVVGERVSRQRQLPHLTTLMGQDVLPNNRRYLRALTPARCKQLVALSAFHAEAFQKSTGLQAGHIIPWGIGDEQALLGGQPPSAELDVLGVGSLVRVKNWEKWLRVVAQVAQTQPSLRAELIGEGPERGHLEAFARQLGLIKHLHFTGALPRPEVLRRMQSSKVLLHAADFESFGYVLAEAADMGCQVVSTPVGIAPEMGVAVGGTEAALAAQTIRFLKNPAWVAPVKRFTMRQTTEQYLHLYDSFLHPLSPPARF